MPRYYFHIHGRDGTIPDEEGSALPNIAAAKAEGLAAVREMLADSVKRGRGPDGRELWIVDKKGKVLFALPFHEIVST